MNKNQFDFCYVYDDGLEKKLNDYLYEERMDPSSCSLRRMRHFTGCFELFFDLSSKNGNPSRGLTGISTIGDLTVVENIPIGMQPIAIVHFNQSEYEKS